MADKVEKKEEKKDDKKSGGGDNFTIFGLDLSQIILLLIMLSGFFFVILPRFTYEGNVEYANNVNSDKVKEPDVQGFIKNVFSSSTEVVKDSQGNVVSTIQKQSLIDESKARIYDWYNDLSALVIILSIFLTLLFYSLTLYFNFSSNEIKDEYKKKILPTIKGEDGISASYGTDDTNGISNPRWDKVLAYSSSGNPSDWRLAILEADMMLFDILQKSGFDGVTIGEMLMGADKSKLQNLDHAWRAHKVRNEIAHSGMNYNLTRIKTDEVIEQYRIVFTELNLI